MPSFFKKLLKKGAGGNGANAKTHNFEPEQVEKLRQLFEQVDKDMSGTVSAKELIECMQHMGRADFTDLKEAQQWINLIDKRGDGQLTFEEFLAWAWQLQHDPAEQQQLRRAFFALDVDGSGEITKQEMATIVADNFNRNNNKIRKDLERYFGQIDKNGDGKVNYDEFMAFFWNELDKD